ncbi:hypothetical protein HOK09_04015 [Candidatus Woesearchaeota archaeon]|mgnify:CR=1 FL=1|jgi:hypothetical protein|nr:hypothetical protein [Candidatus Woesearchaeota archaeon]
MLDKILSFLGGGVIEEVGGVLDNLTTSKEEKLEAERKIKQILVNAEQAAQEQVSRRWEADMKSGHWLSANIRPITLIFLTTMFVILSVFDGNVGDFTINDAYKPIYQTLLITVYGAYFAGRSIEKVKGAIK